MCSQCVVKKPSFYKGLRSENYSHSVNTLSLPLETNTDIVLDRNYLSFKKIYKESIFITAANTVAFWCRINRETLKSEETKDALLTPRELIPARSMDKFKWRVTGQCQIGHFEVPEELPPTPFPHHPEPLPNQKF